MGTLWRGVDLASGVLVRHAPDTDEAGRKRRMTGAAAISGKSTASALDYIRREGRWAEKSDIDREPTRDDERLMERFGPDAGDGRDAVSDRLDYASREGEYSGKGAARMTDASLWGQRGPLSKDDVERDMRQCGGAFMDSVVSVRRGDAEALGLADKEGFQRLLRETWARQAARWQWFRGDESDVRWCAAFHDDADASLHCHVLTWSASGRIPERGTVGRRETSEGKEVVLRTAYEQPRIERNERAEWLRDMARQQSMLSIGERGDERKQERLRDKGRDRDWPERLSDGCDMDPAALARANALRARLADEIARGRGRLSDNWRANSAARDIYKLERQKSPAMREICEAFDLMAEAKADMKGLTGHDRDVLVRDEREDLAKRCSNAIRALEAPSRRGADPAARDKADERWRRRDAGPGDRDPGRPRSAKAAVAREYGMRLDQAARLERASASLARGAARCAAADYERAPASVRRAAEAVAREAAASPRVAREIFERAGLISAETGRPRQEVSAEIRAAVVSSLAREAYRRAAANAREGGPVRTHADPAREMSSLIEAAAEFATSLSGAASGGSASFRPARRRARDIDRDRETERGR